MRLCRAIPNSDWSWGIEFFYLHQNNHDTFFFLHIFWSPAFDCTIGAINESRSYMLTSAILKIDVLCEVTMMAIPSVLTTELCDCLVNQCIYNMVMIRFFIYPTGRIRVCKIRFVSTGENHGKPCLVYKTVVIILIFSTQYPVDGAKDHIEMAQRVLDSDYLCPNFVSDKAQDIVNKVSLFFPYKYYE